MLIDYKILYQDNMTSYYLSETFKTEQETEKYIEDILEDESRLFYSVEKVRLTC
jgi:DNA-binding phage protein|tara:strand:+ start:1621 stop:1782 length:162 start_codon:yes stop_codon:yes gene_type:complete